VDPEAFDSDENPSIGEPGLEMFGCSWTDELLPNCPVRKK
jgi:hypothetical protein